MKTEAEVRRAADFLDAINGDGLYDDGDSTTHNALVVRSVFAWVLGQNIGELDGWANESMPYLESILWLSPGALSNPEAAQDDDL
jgi:hypothetical protein